MPARDIYHNVVKNALEKDGWVITHDPLRLQWGTKDLYADLGAEKILNAEKNGQKIAVEIKSFIGLSDLTELEKAVGQFLVYRSVITRTQPERKLYLAVNYDVFAEIFAEKLGEILIADYQLSIIIFDLLTEVIKEWIN